MRILLRRASTLLLVATAGVLAAACAAVRPPTTELAQAQQAVQDAQAANADRLVSSRYAAAAAYLKSAETTWRDRKDAASATHLARLAEASANDAQYRAEAITAADRLRSDAERRRLNELAVRDAEIALLQSQARTDAEKRAADAAARALEDRRKLEAELSRREAATLEAERARQEGRLAAESALRAEEERRQLAAELAAREAARRQAEERAEAERTKLKAELEEARAALDEMSRAAAAERQRLEAQQKENEARAAELARLREEQQRTQERLQLTLARLAEVRREARGLIVTLSGSIYFDVNKTNVKPSMSERLTEIGRVLAGAPGQKLVIEGHTDSDGSAEYNLNLSRLRAEAVRSILVAGGVTPDRIQTIGYGETKPRGANDTAAGKAQNRRVEIVLQEAPAATANP